MNSSAFFTRAVPAKAAAAFILFTATLAQAQSTHSIFPLLPPSVSTIPSNGDVNPYGVAFAPKTIPIAGGMLQPGDILVSNFNSAQNLQGTGTTLIRVDKTGKTSTFYTSPVSRSGPSAALGILSNGFVLAGNLPTIDGTTATIGPGTLSVLDRNGIFLGTFGTLSTVDGPWGMAVHDTGNGSGNATVFLSNVLSGIVTRFSISYSPTTISASDMVLANGFDHRVDPAALVLGPSGMAYDATHDILYVASSSDNAIYEIQAAATTPVTVSATILFQDFTHLHGPLDLAILPNGHFLVANSDGSNVDQMQPSEIVEFTAQGAFLGQMPVNPTNGGAFGLATVNIAWGTFRWAAVDDNTNTLNIWTSVAQ